MAAQYNGFEFKTPLEAQWAAFFDLAGWGWRYNPVAVGNWKPDFHVEFPCRHSECGGSHTLLVSILSVADLNGVRGHPALSHTYVVRLSDRDPSRADAGAVFGNSPRVSYWEMSHGAGGGAEDVGGWVDGMDALWKRAAEQVASSS